MQSKTTLALLFTGAAFGWLAAVIAGPKILHADDRRGSAKVAFKSGGERSVEVLEKISKQIQTLDRRLAAIEASVAGKPKQ